MSISFGKFVPVKVFIDGKEIQSKDGKTVPKEVERATLTLCDCLAMDKNYPNIYLAEQQRRFFRSKVSDYETPKKPAQNKREILPSTVKTVNVDGQRYLVTGKDISAVQEIGHNLGSQTKANMERAEDYIGSRADYMKHTEFQKEVSRIAYSDNQSAKQSRINALKRLIKDRSIDETLYLNVATNPDAKLEREKYRVTLIDFKA